MGFDSIKTILTDDHKGKETVLGQHKAYVVGSNGERAILFIHDIISWRSANSRALADYYSRKLDATVYIPDFFGGEEPVLTPNYDFEAFKSRNGKHVRTTEIYEVTKLLRSKHAKLGCVGYCFGGWSGLELGKEGNDLLDCLSIAHPTWVEKHEMENVGIPTQIIAPEHDQAFTPELKKLANEVIPTRSVPYSYQYFPGVVHSFASQPKLEDPKDVAAFERAQKVTVSWLEQFL